MRYLRADEAAPGTVGNEACYVVERPDGRGLCGFAEVMMRSHAEGAWEHTIDRLGVAHLEAWWVDLDARGTGVGRALIRACEEWARAQGSPVLASDAELQNEASQAAHEALGFTEVQRCVHYMREL